MKKGIIFVISGPSGAGKSTIIKEIERHDKNIKFSVSATTRRRRRGEKEGINYFFVTKPKFKEMIKDHKFIEWAKFQNNYYGTPESFIKDTVKNGFDCILDIDVQGALQVKNKIKDAIFIFITPKSISVLKKRLLNRKTEDGDIIEKRLLTAHKEMQYIDMYDYFVINDELEKAVKDIKSIIKAERCKTFRDPEIVKVLKKKI